MKNILPQLEQKRLKIIFITVIIVEPVKYKYLNKKLYLNGFSI